MRIFCRITANRSFIVVCLMEGLELFNVEKVQTPPPLARAICVTQTLSVRLENVDKACSDRQGETLKPRGAVGDLPFYHPRGLFLGRDSSLKMNDVITLQGSFLTFLSCRVPSPERYHYLAECLTCSIFVKTVFH